MINFKKGPALSLHQVNYLGKAKTDEGIVAGMVVTINGQGQVVSITVNNPGVGYGAGTTVTLGTDYKGAIGAQGTTGSQGVQGIIGTQALQGALQQQNAQQVINQGIQNYATAQQYPLMQLGTMSNMLRGLPMQSQTTQMYQAQPTATQQAIGLGGTAAMLGTAFGAGAGKKEGGIMAIKKTKAKETMGSKSMGGVKTAAPSRDGIAQKGKTKGTHVKMSGNTIGNGPLVHTK